MALCLRRFPTGYIVNEETWRCVSTGFASRSSPQLHCIDVDMASESSQAGSTGENSEVDTRATTNLRHRQTKGSHPIIPPVLNNVMRRARRALDDTQEQTRAATIYAQSQ